MGERPAAGGEPRATLAELAGLFVRLGCTAFGGPAAHIAIMESEVVRRRRWLSPERFLDLLGAANLIPGPSSTELAMFIGYEQRGWRGLLVGGGCFILPAAAIVGVFAWAYVRFGALPHVGGILYGIKPVVVAVIVQALMALAPKALKGSRRLAAIGVAATVAAALGVEPVAVLGGAGLLAATLRTRGRGPSAAPALMLSGPSLAAGAAAAPGLGALFGVFLKMGAFVFGSGYVLVALLRADLVERLHWLREDQLLDAVAVGQVTPGPVFTTATFIGYLVQGWPGAVAATVAIFLPGFLLVLATRPLLARLRGSPGAAGFLDGVNVAALALMAVVGAQLARAALRDAPALGMAALSALLLLRYRLNSAWLVLGGAAMGLVLHGAIRLP